MNLIEVMERFPNQEACIEHLERLRWRGKPVCPHCDSKIVWKKECGEGRVGRFHCYACNASLGECAGQGCPAYGVRGNVTSLFRNGITQSPVLCEQCAPR